MVEIEKWVALYEAAVTKAFQSRVLFIGLQGSYGRKEATKTSNIDMVLILDRVDFEDLKTYKEASLTLPSRELLCGFISGRKEMENWSRYDLFQLYNDTIAIRGLLEDIISPIMPNDAKEAVLIGACNIYHVCGHNFLHDMNLKALSSLFKSAFFVLQAKIHCDTGRYIRSRYEMTSFVFEEDSAVLEVSMNPGVISESSFLEYSRLLLEWSGKLICRYGGQR